MKPTPIAPLQPGQVESTDEDGVLWRSLPYESSLRVSSTGRVQHWDRRKGSGPKGQREGFWRERRVMIKNGRLFVNERRHGGYVDRLVAHAFLGPDAWLHRVAFVNYDMTDVRVENMTIVPPVGGGTGVPRDRKAKPKRLCAGTARRFTDEQAQTLINDWHAGKYDKMSEAALALRLSEGTVANIIRGSVRKHLERPQERRTYCSRYSIHMLRRIVAEWNAGRWQTKKEVTQSYDIEKTYVVRLLNGDAPPGLYKLIGNVTRIKRIGRKKHLSTENTQCSPS